MEIYGGRVLSGEAYSQSIFLHLHLKVDKCRSNSFLITLLFYIIGFCLIIYVVIENLIWVVKYVFPKVFGL